MAYAARDPLWQAFRKQFPYHAQTIALSERRADGSMVLLIAEPPPHATLAAIQAIFEPFGALFEVWKHPIGYDGWVKDLVGVLARVPDDGSFEAALLELHRYCFFTDYKSDVFYLERTPPARTGRTALNLDLQAAEFQQWLENDELFFPFRGGDSQPLTEILNQNGRGIYYSREPGIVAWILPRPADINDHKEEIRAFALDADLVLGAVAHPQGLAILGRERVEDLAFLPPLRTESVLTLAAASQYELGQSYERNFIFAGRYDDSHDWAPIYLDDALLHTETGSLLNLTDQLLKSWSCNGAVRYYNFETYPDPPSWCFDKSLPEELKVRSLTFNWNAQGASYALEGDLLEYFTLLRTGALPVSYIPNESDPSPTAANSAVKSYEDRAYRCFAGWEDPHLVRVAQYSALFQIFRRYGITAGIRQPEATHSSAPQEEVRRLLEAIQLMDSTDMARLAWQLGKKGVRLTGFPPEQEQAIWESRAKQALTELEPMVEKVKKGLQDIRSRYGERGYTFLLETIADRRRETVYLDGRFVLARYHDFAGDCNFLLQALVDKASFRAKLSGSLETVSGPWIKTPSLVISQADIPDYRNDEGKRVSLVGGHNIGLDFPRFRPDPDIPVGKVEVDRNRYGNIVRFNPADLPRLSPQVLRSAGRRVGAEDLAQLGRDIEEDMRRAEPASLRERTAVLPPAERSAGRGYRPQSSRPAGASLVREPVPDIQWELSRITCSNLLTDQRLEKLPSSLFTRHGAFDLFKSNGLIVNPGQEGNAIYFLAEDLAGISDLEWVKSSISGFLDLLPPPGKERWETDALMIQTIREKEAEMLVLLFRLEGKYMGFVNRLGRGAEVDERYVRTALKKARDIFGTRQVMWYGNEVRKVDVYRIADETGVELLRRSPAVDTEIYPFVSYNHPLQSELFVPENASVFNCVPATPDELKLGSISTAKVEDWMNFKNAIDAQVQGKFRNKTATAAEFKQELIHGNSDVLLLVAHSDGMSVFVGNQRISLAEMQSWEARQLKSGRPRIAILLSCMAGKMEQVKYDWFVFRTQRETLMEVLLKKKYFDFILAPDHEIDPNETKIILDEILKGQSVRGLRTLFKGWIGYVFTDTKRK